MAEPPDGPLGLSIVENRVFTLQMNFHLLVRLQVVPLTHCREVFLPFLDNLSVDASVRYSDYDTVGSANTYKIGIDWAITDELRARATYGTGFRAPNIAELNAGASTGFPVANSPCEFGDRALAAGAISQTTHDNCKALGFDTTDAGEFGFAWQSLS